MILVTYWLHSFYLYMWYINWNNALYKLHKMGSVDVIPARVVFKNDPTGPGMVA